MRLRKKAWARPLLDDYTNRIVITKLDFLTNPIKDVFKNDNKLVLEIGTGKGDFISELASKNPDINYIGIEQVETVLAIALKKIIDKELANKYASRIIEMKDGKVIKDNYIKKDENDLENKKTSSI